MRKFLYILFCLIGVSCFAQDFVRSSPFGFRMATNVTAATYDWTNNNAYPIRLLNITLNDSSAVTSTVSVIRPYSYTRQFYSGDVTTNKMGIIETNFTHVVTNTVISYATNVIWSVTNSTVSTIDEDDFPKMYLQRNDILRFYFVTTNTVGILLDVLR